MLLKGTMKEDMKLLLSYIFQQMELHHLEAYIQSENIPSIKLV